MIGGNAVGLFISEVCPSLKDVTPGDQILQVNGQDTSHMTHFEATDLLRSSERVTLVVTENNARMSSVCVWKVFLTRRVAGNVSIALGSVKTR